MKRLSLILSVSLIAGGCAATAPTPGETDSGAEIAALRARVAALEEENARLDLTLQDEIERGTIQVFLIRQELAAARREAEALRARCGVPCADLD